MLIKILSFHYACVSSAENGTAYLGELATVFGAPHLLLPLPLRLPLSSCFAPYRFDSYKQREFYLLHTRISSHLGVTHDIKTLASKIVKRTSWMSM